MPPPPSLSPWPFYPHTPPYHPGSSTPTPSLSPWPFYPHPPPYYPCPSTPTPLPITLALLTPPPPCHPGPSTPTTLPITSALYPHLLSQLLQHFKIIYFQFQLKAIISIVRTVHDNSNHKNNYMIIKPL